MIQEPLIHIGMITDGIPRYRRSGPFYRIENLLIGAGFHWQQPVAATVDGAIEETAAENDIRLINRIPLEKYVASVIGSEMNPKAPMEFLKAHAVISRSWAFGKISRSDGESRKQEEGKVDRQNLIVTWQDTADHTGFHVCSDDHCQRYQGIPEDFARRAVEAVEATRGIVLTDSKGRIADTRFSKCCGGRTELFSSCWQAEDPDYLPSVEDPYCDLSDMTSTERKEFLASVLKNYDRTTENFHDWHTIVSKEETRLRLLNRFGRNIGNILHIEVIRRGKSGRITHLRLSGSEGELILGKELAIRRLLSDSHLYSSWFDIRDTGDAWELSGHGWGHGVGLCQIGAARMASAGKSFSEILSFYYPNTDLTRLYE